ncbi:hypothetical protein [Tomitella gaofuii]|uniref:hypothetical protein n=1 Tax=Tomitella gaofuii TaxID=2760083 RepID=UPI0015F815E1|nr:hypothetical protein [Tomitella gaofuii]
MTVLNPVQMAEAIQEIMTEKSRLAVALTQADAEYTTAKRDYEYARALAYRDADGTVKDRDMEVDRETIDARKRCDDAGIAFRYANTRLRDKRDDLSAMQTLSKDVRQAYGATSWEPGA